MKAAKQLGFMSFILYLYVSALSSKIKAIQNQSKKNLCWARLSTY